MSLTTRPPRVAPQPALVRQLGIVSATALVVSNMVGTGIFTSTGYLVGGLGDPTLVLVIWLVGALCALAGAFCYSELGVNYPSSGGEYVYLTEAFGPTWGFLSGVASFFAGFSAPIAAAALAFTRYLAYFWPSLDQSHAQWALGSGDWALRFGPAQILAMLLIALLTLLNCLGLKLVAPVQNVLTSCKLLVLIGFLLLAVLIGNGNWDHLRQVAVRTSDAPLLAAFATNLFFIYVSYSGWNAATYVAEEVRQPSRTLPLALSMGTMLVATLYLLLNLVFFYGVPPEKMKNVEAIGSLASSYLFGPGVAGVFSLLMALSLVSTINAMVTIGPRVYYAMAKNGAFPGIAARVDERFHTPLPAIVCQGLCAMLMTVTPLPSLVIYIGFTLNFFAVMSILSLFVFRRRAGWHRLPVVSFLYPLVPTVFLVVGVWMTYFGLRLKPAISLPSIGLLLLGAAWYRLVHKPAALPLD